MCDPEKDEWEVCEDEDFVYKRRKRQRTAALPPPTAVSEATEAELRRRRLQRKKKTLLKLRRTYAEEMQRWEQLSTKLHEMKVSQQNYCAVEPSLPLPPVEASKEIVWEPLVDEMLLQMEAQEEIIRDISHICDVASRICEDQEEKLKQSFFDLPVWASPDVLMASLSGAVDADIS